MENAKEEAINMQLIGTDSPYKYVWFYLSLFNFNINQQAGLQFYSFKYT